MAINIKLLKKMRDRIAALPNSYFQGWWVVEEKKSPCGAAACLAGEAIICNARTVESGVKTLWKLNDHIGAHRDGPFTRAQKLLRLSDIEANGMFAGNADGWPDKFRTMFDNARGPKTRAKAAVAYLDHLIEGGEVLDEEYRKQVEARNQF
jgi:hypothetical protein